MVERERRRRFDSGQAKHRPGSSLLGGFVYDPREPESFGPTRTRHPSYLSGRCGPYAVYGLVASRLGTGELTMREFFGAIAMVMVLVLGGLLTAVFWVGAFALGSLILSVPIYFLWYAQVELGINLPDPDWKESIQLAGVLVILRYLFKD